MGSASEILPNANGDFSESVMGDLVADALREETGSQIAVVFSGDLDQYLMSGDLTLADVEAAIPNNTDYSVTELTAAELWLLIEDSVSDLVLTEEETIDTTLSQSDRFPQVSGLKLRIDAAGPVGDRILELTMEDGTELEKSDSQTVLTVALPTAALEKISGAEGQSCGGIQEIFLSYLEANSPLEKTQLNRIKIAGAHANPLISSAPVLLIGLIIIVCVVMGIPTILRKKKDPEARESMYIAGLFSLRNKT